MKIYFRKYAKPGLNGWRFWNAFAQGLLHFLPILGILMDVLQSIYNTASFAGLSFHLNMYSPLLAAIIFAVFVIIAAIAGFIPARAHYNTLRKAYEEERWLQYNILKLSAIIRVFNRARIDIPAFNRLFNRKEQPSAPTLLQRLKSLVLLMVSTLAGGIGWASTIGTFFGIKVFSFACILGPISPIMIVALLILLNLSIVIWVNGIADTDYKFHNKDQQYLSLEVLGRTTVLEAVADCAPPTSDLIMGIYDSCHELNGAITECIRPSVILSDSIAIDASVVGTRVSCEVIEQLPTVNDAIDRLFDTRRPEAVRVITASSVKIPQLN